MPTTGFWALVWLKQLKLPEIYGFFRASNENVANSKHSWTEIKTIKGNQAELRLGYLLIHRRSAGS
jgi:hypothetical protein